MNIDDFKTQWAASDRKLETLIHLNVAQLRQTALGTADSAFRRLSRSIGIELVINFAALVALGLFMVENVRSPRFLVPAIALHVFAVTQVAFCVYQLAALRVTDFGAPIVTIQKRLAALRVQRIRVSKWTLLVAPLLWTPLLIVSLKGFLGVDAYAIFDRTWIAVNVLAGAAVIPLMLWVSHRFGERMQRSPTLQRLMNDLAGRNMAAAETFLDELARFERAE